MHLLLHTFQFTIRLVPNFMVLWACYTLIARIKTHVPTECANVFTWIRRLAHTANLKCRKDIIVKLEVVKLGNELKRNR